VAALETAAADVACTEQSLTFFLTEAH
jgi:hypothetical protein